MTLLFAILFSLITTHPTSDKTAPNFLFELENGTIQQLEDYKGKVIYLSFWASWCKPCINNFHKYEPIRKELEEMGVVLLNVNLDEDKEIWKAMLPKHPINGLNVHTGPRRDLMKTYQLYSIPAYEIIDKEGVFYYLSNSPDRNIVSEFKSLLEQ